MEKNNKGSWERDFKEFSDTENSVVPTALSTQVTTAIHGLLHPSAWLVFTKLAVIQALAGTISLLACPQFGVSFTSSHGLMKYLMPYGMGFCMVGCGALFLGLSLVIASFYLKPEEIRTIREHRFLQISSLTALSIGAFICFGADVVISLALFWAAGAAVGGLASLELGWAVRRMAYGRKVL